MISTWYRLPRPLAATNIPPLLVNIQISPTGYTILLTDLTYIWSETLDRLGVVRRALRENTSIDPSEDTDQFKILLEKLRGALQGSSESTVQLCHLEDRKLLLRLSLPLPAPLRQLQWPLHLSPASPTRLRTEFLMPLLGQYALQERLTESLLATIKEKDHVITKLVDKLDSSGVEVSTVFLSVALLKAGKKPLSWDAAGKAFKGLTAFNEQEWRTGFEANRQIDLRGDDILQDVLPGSPLEKGTTSSQARNPDAAEGWWNSLDRTGVPASENIFGARSKAGAIDRPATSNGRYDTHWRDTEDSNDEFQRQKTPPSLRDIHATRSSSMHKALDDPAKCASNKIQMNDDETTGEESDHSAPLIRRRSNDQPALDPKGTIESRSRPDDKGVGFDSSKSGSTKRLGVIGGRRVLTVDGRHNESKLGSQVRAGTENPDIADTEEAQAHAIQSSNSVGRMSPQLITREPSKPSHRLGRIGGIKMSRDLAISNQPETACSHVEKHVAEENTGGQPSSDGDGRTNPLKSERQFSQPVPSELQQKRPAASSEPSQETADQRRAELRRQLELKSTAPAKKKRKF